jgi:hypothetical protein
MDPAVARQVSDDHFVQLVSPRKQRLLYPDPYSRAKAEAIVDHMAREQAGTRGEQRSAMQVAGDFVFVDARDQHRGATRVPSCAAAARRPRRPWADAKASPATCTTAAR